MSDLSMWFGTRGYMQWVPCPLVDSDMSKVGWQSQAQYLNGGTRVRSSVTAHKEYNLAWGLQERDNIRTITDYADGVYGDELVYFVDPFAADKNLLPQYWAAPALGIEDAPVLSGVAKPSIVETDSNTNKYPRYSAIYFIEPTDSKKSIYIPIPPGYTAWVGFHGQKPDDSTAYVRVRQAIGATGYGTYTALTPLTVDTTVRVNTNFNSSTTVHGIVIDLQGTGTLIMTGLIVQLHKTSSSYGYTRTNIAVNPRMVTAALPAANNGTLNPVTKNVSVPAVHPAGVTTCLESSSTGTNSTLLSVYGLDGRVDTGSVERTHGVWVYVNEDGYQVANAGGWSETPLTANTWTWVQQTTAVDAGSWAGFSVAKISGNASTTARAYITGVIAEAGTTAPENFFDGSTGMSGSSTYSWTSAINLSTSREFTMPSIGGFISGQGHSGCKFAEQPKLQNYSSAMDKSALTAKLVEVGAWA